ncbi:MAG TPA: hypothetical protein EYH05_14965 [Anaerolineae bacterium]|nr:hypothetical protein [Anaerolineae bacterium]
MTCLPYEEPVSFPDKIKKTRLLSRVLLKSGAVTYFYLAFNDPLATGAAWVIAKKVKIKVSGLLCHDGQTIAL